MTPQPEEAEAYPHIRRASEPTGNPSSKPQPRHDQRAQAQDKVRPREKEPSPTPSHPAPRIASKRKRTERYGCVKNERTQGSTDHGRYASVVRHAIRLYGIAAPLKLSLWGQAIHEEPSISLCVALPANAPLPSDQESWLSSYSLIILVPCLLLLTRCIQGEKWLRIRFE